LKTGRIIGVVKDFNYKSLYDKIEPAVLQIYPFAAWKVAVKLKTAGIDASIDRVTAIFVGCLGLFGLAAYTAETRRKEVGIRKILGASAEGLAVLLSRDFISPVIISLLIASPIGWYFMSHWLQDFAYRVPLTPGAFLLAGLAAILIAILAVSWQAIRAAVANPIQSLRTE
jgi:putative ABC transport system permease protein